uniref:Uncharacterized protein n=1 Tax=Parascaris equorum TaxID=6256 RepID=A0A914RDM8_PAREQ
MVQPLLRRSLHYSLALLSCPRNPHLESSIIIYLNENYANLKRNCGSEKIRAYF